MGIQVSPGLRVSAEICMTGAPGPGCACGCLIDGERQLPEVSRGDSEETATRRATPRLIHSFEELESEAPLRIRARGASRQRLPCDHERHQVDSTGN